MGASYLAVGWLARWARRHALDLPNERSSHAVPTPRGGGAVIAGLALIGVAPLLLLAEVPVPWLQLLGYAVGAAAIAAVSWLDDLHTLPYRTRLSIHILGAVLALVALGFWRQVALPALGPVRIGWLGLPLAFLWLVGLTNAYNFMDGIDGLAGTQALLAGLGWVAIGLFVGNPLVASLGALVAGSSLGFLGHNWPPARIFMGDVGSAFLGYTFAVLPLFAAQATDERVAAKTAVAGLLLVWPFVFDSGFTFIGRLRRRENVFAAHRSHLYQRLVIAGRSHLAVTCLYGALDLVGLALALLWLSGSPLGDVLIVTVIPALCLGLWLFVVREERNRAGEGNQKAA